MASSNDYDLQLEMIPQDNNLSMRQLNLLQPDRVSYEYYDDGGGGAGGDDDGRGGGGGGGDDDVGGGGDDDGVGGGRDDDGGGGGAVVDSNGVEVGASSGGVVGASSGEGEEGAGPEEGEEEEGKKKEGEGGGADVNNDDEDDDSLENDYQSSSSSCSEIPPARPPIKHNVYGGIEGVAIGDWWLTSRECWHAGVHRPPNTSAFLHCGPQGAYSITLSDQCSADDVDGGDRFTLSTGGKGAADTGSNEQTLSFDTVTLVASKESGNPIRLVRTHKLKSAYAPDIGYRYDGLYEVENYWVATSLDGATVYKFLFRRLGEQSGQAPPPWLVHKIVPPQLHRSVQAKYARAISIASRRARTGVAIGDWWLTSRECWHAGVHRPPNTSAFLHCGPQGAYSITLSDQCSADDVDGGDRFTLSTGGKGAADTGSNEQTLSFDTVTLVASKESGNPIRLVRTHKLKSAYAPDIGYRYDGLYEVENYWVATSLDGATVYKFLFRRLGEQSGQAPPPWLVHKIVPPQLHRSVQAKYARAISIASRRARTGIQLIIDGGRHVCYKCGKSYKEKRTLSYHLKYECGVEPQFRCPQCPYRAKQKSSLESHFALKHLNEMNKQRCNQ
ncbi:uncharacterized protein LOC111047469 [Nilaparvata lugens]|uniref:uncharacterized protein LOC111047469 n=1 Tax=Nilaparvata lugens TaxID=108931 RepID=UPI00193DBAD0|nr:uncharacterized protein LOC111047469 [Nilaparvata lugens]XP_039284673.1 uncharacterized protein LOC111047469 [Nilaparvata lugens]